MDAAIETVQTLDVKTLLAIGAMMFAACGIMCKIMMVGFGQMNQRFDQIDKRFDRMDHRIDKMQETITDIDRRLCRLEGAFQSKECCLLKSDTQHKAAE